MNASPKFATNQSNDPWPNHMLRAANKMKQAGWTYRQSCETISASSSSSCCCCSLLASLLQSGILYKTIRHPHTVSGRQTFQDYLCHQVTQLLATGPGTGVFLCLRCKTHWNQRSVVEFHDNWWSLAGAWKFWNLRLLHGTTRFEKRNAREFDLEAHTLSSKRESYNSMIALPET